MSFSLNKTSPIHRFLFLAISFCLCHQISFAQTNTAKEYMKNGNYLDALSSMLSSYRSNQGDLELAHNIAICYLNTNIDKKAALLYIEKVFEAGGKNIDADVVYEYALSLTYHLKYDEAKKAFQQYKDMGASQKYKGLIDRNINNCDVAQRLLEQPLNISMSNLGNKVNSKYPDYYPFVSKNDSVLYFTSRRSSNIGGSKEFDGYYPADIYYYILNKEISRAKNVGKMLNTIGDDQVVGLSNDGGNIFIYFDVVDQYGDIYTATNNAGKFSRNFKLSPTINTKDLETSASISEDGNTLFFASNRPGGEGGLDLYMSRKLPDGNWGTPQNLGKDINTAFDEDFPQLSTDGNSLFFSSTGLPGMGGADIFSSKWNPDNNEWSTPINIGYPINTPSDNMTISFSLDETRAYISANRNDSYGDYDIYRVDFHDRKTSKAVFIYSSGNKNLDDDIELVVSDKNEEIIGIYRPNSRGKFIVILDIGSYKVDIEDENGVIFSTILTVNSEDVSRITNYRSFKLN